MSGGALVRGRVPAEVVSDKSLSPIFLLLEEGALNGLVILGDKSDLDGNGEILDVQRRGRLSGHAVLVDSEVQELTLGVHSRLEVFGGRRKSEANILSVGGFNELVQFGSRDLNVARRSPALLLRCDGGVLLNGGPIRVGSRRVRLLVLIDGGQ